ncbi:MAG: hypothetical protein K6G22_06500 [Lachnospiraceae bacterium]|nr:hypothetical protein [Lachnospiraceae bacterium]
MVGNYRIVYEAKLDKQEAVINIECTCPVCGKRNGVRVKEIHPNVHSVHNYYTCPECGTEWQGNTYTNGWDRIDARAFLSHNMTSVIRIAYAVLTTMLGLAIPALFPLITVMHISALIMLLIARLVELKETGDTKKMDFIKGTVLIAIGVNIIVQWIWLILK